MIFRDKKLKLISLNILLLASLSVLLGATPPLPTLPPAPSLPPNTYTEHTGEITIVYETVKTAPRTTTTEGPLWTMPPTTTAPPRRPMFNVTFSPNIYGNFTGPIEITLSNKTTGEMYTFSLYKSSNFFKMVEVSAGEYEMVGGMVSGDYNRKFPVELVSFSVGQYGNIMIAFDVGTNPSPEKKTTIAQVPQTTHTGNGASSFYSDADDYIVPNPSESGDDYTGQDSAKKSNTIKIAGYTTLVVMLFAFVGLLAVVIYKKKENNK